MVINFQLHLCFLPLCYCPIFNIGRRSCCLFHMWLIGLLMLCSGLLFCFPARFFSAFSLFSRFYLIYILLEAILIPFYLFVKKKWLVLNNVNGQVPIAVDMAKDSNGKDRDLKKRLGNDYYFSCAIEECYASFKNIIKHLVQGEQEKRCLSYTWLQWVLDFIY